MEELNVSLKKKDNKLIEKMKIMEKIQKLELKLTATTKVLEECKVHTKNNYECLKKHQNDKMKKLKVLLKKKDEEIIECKKAAKK